MDIILSKYYGPCFGVYKAFEKAVGFPLKAKLLGQIAHNEILIKKIKNNKNITIINDISDIKKNDTVIIRTHGITLTDYKKIISKDVNIIDQTCHKVKMVQKIAENAEQTNKIFILVGNAKHPEVAGVASRCKTTFVVDSVKSAKNLFSNVQFRCQNIVVASQTTFDIKDFENICKIIKKMNNNPKIYNTICNDSLNRRSELELIANFADLSIVLGSKISSNSKNLFKSSETFFKYSLFVENPKDFKCDVLKNKKRIFITSAASVLKETVLELLEKIHNNLNEKINLKQII